jgi:hypothetical protein
VESTFRAFGAAFTCFLLAGCGLQPKMTADVQSSFEQWKGHDHFKNDRSVAAGTGIGIALAGGGTRAAAISIGVLEGLQEAGIVPAAEVISSVSGGSYGAYWWFSRQAHLGQLPAASRAFVDCFPERYKWTMASAAATMQENQSLCPPQLTDFDGVSDSFRFQNYIRGFQDVLAPTTFDYSTTGEDRGRVIRNFAKVFGLSILAGVPNFIANVLFDWQVDLSPSRAIYRHGIGTTYGAEVTDCATLDAEGRKGCQHSRPPQLAPSLSFGDLHRLWKRGFPLWVINAHAGGGRSGLDVTGAEPAQFTAFEFTPKGFGSATYGFHDPSTLEPGFFARDAVAASGAFFTVQQKEFDFPKRNVLNLFLLATTLNWGVSIRNPNISAERRMAHMLLPFPLYYAHGFRAERDSAFIALADGGLSDNTGAYALLRRGLATWIISDHSDDRSGRMPRICKLRESLSHLGLYLRFPGLKDLDVICSEGSGLGYDVFYWRYPILLGCVTSGAETCERPQHRILLLKPAFNASLFVGGKFKAGDPDHLGAWEDVANSCRIDPSSADCKGATERFDCSAPAFGFIRPGAFANDRFDANLPCEVMGFMLMNGFGAAKSPEDDCPRFPQHSSVLSTANSSFSKYGAYRELSRWYSRQLGYFFDGTRLREDRFNAILGHQDGNKMTPVESGDGGFIESRKAGKPDRCLLLEPKADGKFWGHAWGQQRKGEVPM